jgi:hypothetical protein
LLDAVCDLLPQVTFGLLQATGHIGSGGTELLAERGIETFDLARNFCFYIHLHGSRKSAQENDRKPKQDKGSGQHGGER